MKLRVLALCHYLTGRDVEWRDANYQARAIVKSFKDEDFGGNVSIRIGKQRYRFNKHNRDELVSRLIPLVGRKILSEIRVPVSLVPVPNSTATVADPQEFRTAALAKRIGVVTGPQVMPVPALRWKQVRTKSHKGSGRRRVDDYIDHLSVVEQLRRPVVLFDDMSTSGSQMLACAHVLEQAGHEVLFGVVAGRRTEQQVEKALGWTDFEVEQQTVAEMFENFS